MMQKMHWVATNEHDGNYILELVKNAIEELGTKNVIQIVTDRASNNMKAYKILVLKTPNIFWTTCLTYIKSMLDNIFKIRLIQSAHMVKRSVSYRHTISLHII